MNAKSVHQDVDVDGMPRRHSSDEPPIGAPRDVVCDDCGAVLDLTQPDTEDPDHLIGKCLDCVNSFAVLNLVGQAPLVRRIHFPRPRRRRGLDRAAAD